MKLIKQEKDMKANLAKCIWKHKSIIQKATPFFSTQPIVVDQYAAFYEVNLAEKPIETDAERKYRLVRLQ